MSTRFVKDKIYGVQVPQFQIDYISDTTNPSHRILVKLCHDVHYMWWREKIVGTSIVVGLNKVLENHNLSYYYVCYKQ